MFLPIFPGICFYVLGHFTVLLVRSSTCLSDVGFPSVCCEYHWLIKKLIWAYNRTEYSQDERDVQRQQEESERHNVATEGLRLQGTLPVWAVGKPTIDLHTSLSCYSLNSSAVVAQKQPLLCLLGAGSIMLLIQLPKPRARTLRRLGLQSCARVLSSTEATLENYRIQF